MYLLRLEMMASFLLLAMLETYLKFHLEAGKLHLRGWPKKKNDDANGEKALLFATYC